MSVQELQTSLGVLFPAFSLLPMKAERSRNKERLEASLAGLCELELLKQRQELRVLGALCLGDPPDSPPPPPPLAALRTGRGAPDAPAGEEAQNSGLHCTPWGFKASLEQQVAELKVNSEVKAADSSADVEKSQSPGEVHVAKQSRSTESAPCSPSAPEGTAETGETGEMWLSDPMRKAMVADALREIRAFDSSQEGPQQIQKLETYIFGIIQRKALPMRPSKPRTSLAHDTRAASVVRQSSLCCKEEQHSPRPVPAQETLTQCSEGSPPQACHNPDQERNLGTGSAGGATPACHQHLQQSAQHQPWLNHRPRQAPMMNASRPTVFDYPTVRLLQAQPESSNSESDSPQHFHNYLSPPVVSKPHQPLPPEEQLVNAEYIAAQPCQASNRSYAYHHSNPHKGSGVPKTNQSTYSPERGHHHHHHHHHQQEQQPTASHSQPLKSRGGQKKCRTSEERSGATRKPGKKACRSQSENSLPRAPEGKYNVVERDGAGSGSGGGRGSRGSQSKSKKQQQQGGGNYRRWQSSLDLSQDEADQPPAQAPAQGMSASHQRDHCGKRTRKSRPMPTLYSYSHHHHHHHHQQMEYQLERGQVAMCPQPSESYHHAGQGESESSTSEADSPDSSSLSSDSDESGGLVWPQQLPPQLSLPASSAPPGASQQPKAFVKIKASHALKKKILRFRTGSLKVMTTV